MSQSRSWGAGTAAVARYLIDNASVPASGVAIARTVGVTQPRGSQILTALTASGAARLHSDGWTGDVEALFDLYLTRSRPHLILPETYWYSTKPLKQQVSLLSAVASGRRSRFGVSADIGPDLLVPWRHPTLCITYADAHVDLSEAGFVPAEGQADSSIILRVVDDPTLFVSSDKQPLIVDGIPLVNPIQQWADLVRLGGADRLEAAKRLRKAIADRKLPR